MAGYTRGFDSNDGELITASLFFQEYEALDNAFDSAAGHAHSGEVGEGALVPKIAKDGDEVLCGGTGNVSFSVSVGGTATPQLSLIDGALLPVHQGVDLGSATIKFADGYLSALTIGLGNRVDIILNDGGMVDNSPTALVTQQSIVSYTAAEIASATIDGGIY